MGEGAIFPLASLDSFKFSDGWKLCYSTSIMFFPFWLSEYWELGRGENWFLEFVFVLPDPVSAA
jgi:hypothetical protein